MSTNYISITAGLSIKEAMASLIKQAAENDNVTTLYVVDSENTFCGAIDLKDLIIAREGSSLEDITTYSYPYVYADSDAEDCMRRLKDYSEDSIPVLDSDNKLIGVITAQDMVEAVEDELGEDYAKLAGLSSGEDLAEPIRRSVSKRLPWLIILLGLGLIVSSVVGAFEPVVAQLTIIMSFQSLILDMAGNVGTQSLAVTIRADLEGGPGGLQQRRHPRRALLCRRGRVSVLHQGQSRQLLLRHLRLYRAGAHSCHGHLQHFRYSHSPVLPEDQS